MSCDHSIVIDAPLDVVWGVLRNFDDMSWAKGVVESQAHIGSVPVGQVGSTRLLNGVFEETLQALDDHQHLLRYSIDNGPGPLGSGNVHGYIGTVQVLPVTETGSSYVRWSSSWTGGGAGVADFCDPIYSTLLRALRAHCSNT